MTRKTLLIVSVLAGVQVMVLILYAGGIREAVFPVVPKSIEAPAQIDLGNVALNTQLQVPLRVRNKTGRAIELESPLTSCGCVSHTIGSFVLPAHQEKVLDFHFATPTTPQTFSHDIILRSSGQQRHTWQTVINGNASANIWASPPSLELVLNSQGEGDGKAIVSQAKPFDEDSILVTCTSKKVQITTSPVSSNSICVEVSVRDVAATSGEAALHVIRSGAKVLDIPLKWKPRPWARCTPSSIRLDAHGEERAPINETVVILLDPQRTPPAVRATSLVRWVQVSELKQVSTNTMSLSLRIARRDAPENFSGSVVAINCKDMPEWPALYFHISTGGHP